MKITKVELEDLNENGESNWETAICIIGFLLLIFGCGVPSLLIVLNGLTN